MTIVPAKGEAEATTTGAWIVVASILAGGLNYGYALGISAMLAPADYSVFASGHALLLVAGTIANAAVPWVMAREIARAPDSVARGVVWGALLLNAMQGLVVAALLVALSSGFSDAWMSAWLATSAFGFFIASTAMGWAQGHQRFGVLATLIFGEVAVKVVIGSALVALGFGAAGAFAGALVGALAVVLVTLRSMWPELRPRRAGFPRAMFSSALGMAGVQIAVSALAVIDVIYIGLRLGTGGDVASYQLAATISRVPLFLAVAFSTVLFPGLASHPGDRRLLSGHTEVSLYLLLPVLLVLITVPGSLVAWVLPSGYGDVHRLLPLTAGIGTLYAVVTLQTTALRADGRFLACGVPLAVGAVVSMAGMAIGSRDSAFGLGLGALMGAGVAVVGLGIATRRLWPGSIRPRPRAVLIWAPIAAVLALAGREPVVWIVVTVLTGLVVAYRIATGLTPHESAATELPA